MAREGPEHFLVMVTAVAPGLFSLLYICGIADVNYIGEVFMCTRHFSKNVSAGKEVAIVAAVGLMPSVGISVVKHCTGLPL